MVNVCDRGSLVLCGCFCMYLVACVYFMCTIGMTARVYLCMSVSIIVFVLFVCICMWSGWDPTRREIHGWKF